MAEAKNDENRRPVTSARVPNAVEELEFDEVDDFDDEDEASAAASDHLLAEDDEPIKPLSILPHAGNDAFFVRRIEDLSLSNSETERRELASHQMFDYLLRASLKNRHAEAILSDIASGPGLFQEDPILDAIERYRQEHPEKADAVKMAAIRSMQFDSKIPLQAVIAEATTKDPKFAQRTREILGSHLRSGDSRRQGDAVGILLAMSAKWNVDDFQTALRFMQPNQVQDFRKALRNAPFEVQREAILLAMAGRDELQKNSLLSPKVSANDMLTHGTKTTFGADEAAAMQSRLRLIAGEGSEGKPLWGLHKQFGILEPKQDHPHLKDPLFASRRDDPASIFSSSALESPDRKLDEVKRLFNAAFPNHSSFEMTAKRWEPKIDTRYLNATLTASLEDGSNKSITPERLFSRWGVDSAECKTEIDAAAKQYGAETLLAIDRRLQMFNALDPAMRERFTEQGNSNQIDPAELAGLVLNGHLGKGDTRFDFLVDKPPFEQKINEETRNAINIRQSKEKLLSVERKLREENIEMLMQYTTNGVSALDLVGHGLDKMYEFGIESTLPKFLADGEVFTSGVEAFEMHQRSLLNNYRASERIEEERGRELSTVSAMEAQLEFARKVFAYEQLAQSGASQDQKDYVALMMVDHYGMNTIQDRAPQIWNDLKDGGFHRLYENKIIQSERFQLIEGDREARITKARSITDSLQENVNGYLDVGIRRKLALDALDSDKSLLSTQGKVLEFGEKFASFSKLFEAGNRGTKYDAFVDDLKKQAGTLKDLMNSASPQEIADLKDLHKKLSEASDSATDPETIKALKERAESVKGVLDILAPASQQHQDLEKILVDAISRNFSPDDLKNWLKTNGPAIAAAAAAVALTAATMGTGAPVVLLLVSSAAALGATQLTSEVLYQINHRMGDTELGGWNDRSYLGVWGAKHSADFKKLISSSDWTGSAEAAEALITSYVKEVSTPLTAEYATNVIMGLVTMGALRFGQAGLKGLDTKCVKSLVANPRSLEYLNAANRAGMNSSSKAAMSSWLKAIAKETSHESLEEVGQEGVQVVAERALKQANLNSPYASTLLAISMGLAQGKMGSKNHARVDADNSLQIHSSMRADVEERLRATGHQVRTLADGTITAASYKTPKDKVTIRVNDEMPAPARTRRPGSRSSRLDENFRQRFASGDRNDALGPDNRLRQTTLRRQVENNFPEDVRQAAGELVTGGMKRQDLLERMLRMGKTDCEKYGVFDLLKNTHDLDTLTKGVDEAESKSLAPQTTQTPVTNQISMSDKITFRSSDESPVSGTTVRKLEKSAGMPEGFLVDVDDANLSPPSKIPETSELAKIPNTTRDFYRDRDGNVWEVKNGKPHFVDFLAVVQPDRVQSLERDGETFSFQSSTEIQTRAKNTVDTMHSFIERTSKSNDPAAFRNGMLALMAEAPEMMFSVQQLGNLNARQADFLTPFNNPDNQVDYERKNRNCMDCTAALFRSFQSGKVLTVSDVKQTKGENGLPIGFNRPQDGLEFNIAMNKSLEWLKVAADIDLNVSGGE